MKVKVVKELLRLLESISPRQLEGEIVIKVTNGNPVVVSVKKEKNRTTLKLVKNGHG